MEHQKEANETHEYHQTPERWKMKNEKSFEERKTPYTIN